MSITSVNTAVWNWLKPTNGIAVLHQAVPTYMLGDQWQNNGVQGTPAYLHIVDINESRITVPAITGQKRRDYQFLIVCLYQWYIPADASTSPTGGTDGWVTGQLQLLDNIVARIEQDPTFGTGPNGIVFEAGNQDSGIRTHRDGPTLDRNGGKVMAWCHVEFTVTEIVQA